MPYVYVINDDCLGCGACIVTCPGEAITYSGFACEIDPEKCIGCGVCAGWCPAGAIEESD